MYFKPTHGGAVLVMLAVPAKKHKSGGTPVSNYTTHA